MLDGFFDNISSRNITRSRIMILRKSMKKSTRNVSRFPK